MRVFALFVALCLLYAASGYGLEVKESTGTLDKLPEVYVDKGACPFECCTYGDWIVLEETKLYDQPDGTQAVAALERCEKVQGVTGEVHVRPNPVEVIKAMVDDIGNRFEPGDQFYLLTPQGEGFFKAWANGVLFDVDGVFILSKEDCEANINDCWAVYQNEPSEDPWWVQVKTSSGETGWTRQSHFDGQDSCGAPVEECAAP
ncbi:MAG: hypothetical protein HC808_17530 [Candidatus Competibacteraceae bacterium]|nr:hypothetical protein [Candidatus Competibacteraceae bacterium]